MVEQEATVGEWTDGVGDFRGEQRIQLGLWLAGCQTAILLGSIFS
jgi:hypothetical protein